MPIYTYQCQSCKNEFEKYVPYTTSGDPECGECGEATEKIWKVTRHYGSGSTFPFVTKHLNGQPIEVTSESHLQQLCKQYGKVSRPDVGWIEERYEGAEYDRKTGKFKQKYTGGSGRGLPGSWISLIFMAFLFSNVC